MTKYAGTTLLELVLSMSILLIIMVVLVSLWLGGFQNFQVVGFEQHRDTSFLEIFRTMNRDVRSAVVFLDTGQTYIDISRAKSYSVDSDTIVMKLYALKADGTYCTDLFDYVIYDKQGTTLHQIVVPDPGSVRRFHDQTLAKNIQTVTLTQTKQTGQHHAVNALIRMQRQVATRSLVQSRQETMVGRNVID